MDKIGALEDKLLLFAGGDATHLIMNNFVLAAFLGVAMMILAHKLRISVIVLLLISGIVAGPQFLGIIDPSQLGEGLRTIILLAVGIILFEGGLTLDPQGYKKSAQEITGILTKGVLVTWLVSALLVKIIFGYSIAFSLLASSLIIVTGPTVIGPLIKRIGVKKNLHHILHWEGVLIDPIGVFIALLCYEWIISEGGTLTVVHFVSRFLVGTVLGGVFGFVIYNILKRRWVPNNSLNIFVLSSAMLCFAASESILAESGLLSVTIAGFLVGYKKPQQLESIIEYKDELKDFLIGLLFILLAAQLEIDKFLAYGKPLLILVALIMFVVRPLNIFISTRGSDLSIREKLFLSWIAPRGIVAASMASLFAFRLKEFGTAEADFLEAMTYSVIAGTVIFQGFTAKMVGYFLGVLEPKPKDWLIIGANRVARELATFLKGRGIGVVLVDTNTHEVKLALSEGLVARCENALTLDPENREVFYGIGHFLALTGNEDLNRVVCQRWSRLLPKASFYRWGVEEDAHQNENDGQLIWSSLPLKSMLSDTSSHPLFRVDNEPPDTSDRMLLLSAVDEDILVEQVPKQKAESQFLYFQKEHAEPSLPFMSHHVLISEANSLETLFNEMSEMVSSAVPTIDANQLCKDLVAGEKEFSSLIGQGVSLPHLYSDKVDQSLLVVAKVKEPVSCIHSGAKIEMVFLLISPEEQPVLHLNMISRIAQLVMDQDMRNALFSAESSESLFSILTQLNDMEA